MRYSSINANEILVITRAEKRENHCRNNIRASLIYVIEVLNSKNDSNVLDRVRILDIDLNRY